MRVRREKGFKKIEIVDPYSENLKNKCIDLSNTKYRKIIIIFFPTIFTILLFYGIQKLMPETDSDYSKTNFDIMQLNNINNSIYLENITNNNKTNQDKNIIKEKKDEVKNITNESKNIKEDKKGIINSNKNNLNRLYNNTIKIKTIDKKSKVKNIEIIGLDDMFKVKFEEIKNPKISIIIIINNYKKEDIKKVIYSIYNQTFKDIEIIIVDDFLNTTNKEIYDKLKEKDKRIKILEYKEKIGKLKKRFNGINNSNSDYLLFIDADDYFLWEGLLETLNEKIDEKKIDIIEFKSFHIFDLEVDNIIYQPRLFDVMYYGLDYSSPKQFHISGKLIKKELFKKVFDNMDNFYKEYNMQYYEESMLLFILFKKAETFVYLRLKSTYKNCKGYCDSYVHFDNDDNKMKIDYVIYIKYIFENSGNNVPEKRMITQLFRNNILFNSIFFSENNYYRNILIDTCELFCNCEKISENEIESIKNYKDMLINNKNISYLIYKLNRNQN